MTKITIIDDDRRRRAHDAVELAPIGSLVTIREGDLRNLDQNARLHAMLGDISSQVLWHGMKLTPTIWKRLCTASMLREVGEKPQLIPALDGVGIEIIYEKTSEMSKKKVAELILWIEVFGAERNVVWSEKSKTSEREEGR